MKDWAMEMVEDLYEEYYEMYELVRRVKIDPKNLMKDFGREAPFILNYTVPIIVKRGGEHFDELADSLGFERDDEFYQFLLNYRPKYKRAEEIREEMGGRD